jgi:hypothetical protein
LATGSRAGSPSPASHDAGRADPLFRSDLLLDDQANDLETSRQCFRRRTTLRRQLQKLAVFFRSVLMRVHMT